MALVSNKPDSLFNLALNGGEGKYGFLDIVEEYSGTKAANLANYSIGMSYLNLKEYGNAIIYLEKFKSNDILLQSISLGTIGDCFSELNQPDEAFEYYQKAFKHNEKYIQLQNIYLKLHLLGQKLENINLQLIF